MSYESGTSARLARLEVEDLDRDRNLLEKPMEAECSTKCRSPSILRRPSHSSTYSDDRLSIISSTADTLSITLSRRSSRVRFSDIEVPPVSTAMQRRGSADSPSRFEAYGHVGLGVSRIRPSSLPLPSPGYTGNSDFAPKLLPTPLHSPTKSTRPPSLRTRSSIDGLRADLDSHRLSTTTSSRRSSRSSLGESTSRRTSARFSILVDQADLELLAEAEPAFSPLPLRYPSLSRPNSMFEPTESEAGPSVSSRPLSLPISLPLPPLPDSPSSPTRVSLPPPLPIPLPPLPVLEPTAPSRPLSPILDDDVELADPAELDDEAPDHESVKHLSNASPSPTGRKRETTDDSIISLSNVALFPVPPRRNASFDDTSPIILNSPSFEDPISTFGENATDTAVEETDAEAILDEKEEDTDAEAIVDVPALGSSPEISDMIALMKSRQSEDCDEDSEIDLHMPLAEAAIASGIISADSRLLRPRHGVSHPGVPRSASNAQITRKASFTGTAYVSSESEEDEAFARVIRNVTMRKLARSSYLQYKQKEEAESAEIRRKLETPIKRMSNISTSSASSSELETPNPRRATSDIATARESGQWSESRTGVPLSKRYSVPTRLGRVLPHPSRQVKGWGPPEIMIYEESDDEPIALSSSDEESCLPAKDGSSNMSAHYNFDAAKLRKVASASQTSPRAMSENDWLMDEEMLVGGEISDFDESDMLRVPGRSGRV